MSWSRTLKVRQLLRAQLEVGEEIALLFSDIRGFSTYAVEMGDRAAFRLTQLHEGILKDRISEYGILVKSLGDGVMAAFETASLAIQAAVSIQQAFRERNSENPDDPIDVGIGIATGTPVMTDIDFIGHSVNLSQRLSGHAKSGQILVPTALCPKTVLPISLRFVSAGERALKGIGSEFVTEVVWIQEIARISDALDQITLILTEQGTIVVELAKDAKQEIRDAMEQLRRARAEEEGMLSAFLQRQVGRLTQRLMGVPYSAMRIVREQNVRDLRLAVRANTLSVGTTDGTFSLNGVDPLAAKGFIELAQKAQ
ncbi:adenylate/guanylate cyclase domain-containing protein [Candidatus Bipolaricaulota bacterium]|nr:adenylate/guanylate cyclase domain-containing protein [Candidatus Bipolaricaulota bacterium]